MPSSRPLEIESLDELSRRLTAGATDLASWHLQSLDLAALDLGTVSVAGAVFLGCRFGPGQEEDVRARGGLVFPGLPRVPFDPYRATLYAPEDLYAGLADGYAATFDARVYAWSKGRWSLDRTLATALHDHAIADALAEYVASRRRPLVGVMGGHGSARGDDDYRVAAALGHALARESLVVTGGGPGTMEAANLGAYLAGQPAAVLDKATTLLATAPTFRPDATAWARAAMTVRERWPGGADSLGVPTWFYGHEPPNLFAAHSAKYFANAIREDVLLRICRGGIVFLPGAAGTVQEIFQAACENYYAAPAERVPLVLVGVEQWRRTLPAWPLLDALLGTPAGRVHLVDDPADAVRLLSH